jgi:spoIIIJ-associated protein
VKDQVFSGATVEEARAAAARALGLPLERLRYVVLDPGAPAGRGLSPTPARIAVLFDAPGGGAAAGPAAAGPAPALDEQAGSATVLLQDILRSLERALQAPLGAEVEEHADGTLEVRLTGAGRRWLVGEDGEAVAALDHLLKRILASQGYPARLVLTCEGWRERRDEALRERALDLARAVREDGQARRMEPLNSYERRIVHMAVAEMGGLTTFSEGEGHERAVTIAPAAPPDTP